MTNFLLFLTKTDPAIYSYLPQSDKWMRIGVGLFVLFAGVFAFFASSYFVRSYFMTYNEISETINISNFGWMVSLITGLFWSILIMAIEREIASAPSKWAAAIRLPLAIVIGLTIAVPLEVHLFSEKINKELSGSFKQDNYIDEKEGVVIFNDHGQRIIKLLNKIMEERNAMVIWKKRMEEEIGGIEEGSMGLVGGGPAYKAAKFNFEKHEALAEEYENKFLEYHNKVEPVRKKSEEQLLDKQTTQKYRFFIQYRKMNELKRNDKEMTVLSQAILFLCILLTTMPLLIKLFEKDKDAVLVDAV